MYKVEEGRERGGRWMSDELPLAFALRAQEGRS